MRQQATRIKSGPMQQPFVIVIGAGQAGLAAGYHLRRAGLPFLILESRSWVGAVWRERYAGLTLFTPRSYSALSGLPLSGDPDGYASKDEFADYLQAYARTFELPVRVNSKAERLSRGADGRFRIALTSGETLLASHVVIATGGFQEPIVPAAAAGIVPEVRQLTMKTYRSPADIVSGPVLVVGDGASGRDIAMELTGSFDVTLATGKPRKLLPERLFGIST